MTAILLDHFYLIDSHKTEDNTISAQITFNPAHAIFQGHFPDMPVVPGVCQLQIVEEILSTINKKSYKLDSAASVKFLSVIDPGIQPSININITITEKEENLYAVISQYTWQEKVFFKFKGVYSIIA